jgi:hypothetical protein
LCAQNKTDIIEKLVLEGIVRLVKEMEGDLGEEGTVSHNLPTLTKTTFLAYYRCTLDGLIDVMEHVHIVDGLGVGFNLV